ncbi:MAG: DUF4838 domain-containing protein [Cyclobacteriaceae bacterium]|nr:DUF4838 domain-containing protein [Cyclobacteriaceae bacterium]
MDNLFCIERLILVVLCFVCLSCKKSELILVQGQTHNYQIVISEDANLDEQKAAFTLQKYIEAMSGKKLPIISETDLASEKSIWVGATLKTKGLDLEPSEIIYKVIGEGLIVAGGNSKSTLNAVYTFLENELGCRFYAPDVEMIPKGKKITLPIDLNYSYTPKITTRTVHSQLFYEDQDFADKRKVTTEAFPDYVPSARVHTFHHFMPKEMYYDDHPEYYALRGERRVPTQLCLTNKDVLKIVTDTVRAILSGNPASNVISVSQDDNQQYCQCSSCEAIHEQEKAPSGSMIAFVNEVAKSFPDVTISTLAYQYTRKAPKYIKPEDNLLITLCSIECDRSASIDEKCKEFATDLEAWGNITDNVRIWDYTTQFTNYLAPFPNIHTLQPNIQLFRDNNAKWIFEQHSSNPSELFELRSYLTAKLLWDPELSLDSVMSDFLTGYYEEAGGLVGNYIHTIHEEVQKDSTFFLFLYGDPSQAFDSYLRPGLLKQYDSWFNEAEVLVAAKPEVLKRVKRARLGVDYAILEASKQNKEDWLTLVQQDESGNNLTPELLTKRLYAFEETCKISGITAMNEMRFTVDEYLDIYKRTVDRALNKNIAKNKPVELLTKPKKYANENPQTITDGALGGANFYANWLGFEGNDMEAIIDLEEVSEIHKISTAFLQVVNHIVFFPESVSFSGSVDGKTYKKLTSVLNKSPLTPESKLNDIQYFNADFSSTKLRYIKIYADNMETAPVWHHGTGMGAWIFVDEVMVE